MRNSQKSFPYPVLTKENGSILNSSLDFKYSIINDKNLKCLVKVDLKNRDLKKLIKEEKAAFITLIDCPKTRFRKTILSKEYEYEFEIEDFNLKNRVEIASMIISIEDLEYTNKDFDDDSQGDVYFIPKNNILGYDEDITFEIERNTDSMENLPSIFSIILNTESGAPSLTLDLNDNKIKLLLNTKNYELYKNLRENQQLEEILASLFIVPALTMILSQLPDLEDQYGNSNWFHSIVTRLKNLGISKELAKDEAIRYSHEILGETFEKSLEILDEISLIGDE